VETVKTVEMHCYSLDPAQPAPCRLGIRGRRTDHSVTVAPALVGAHAPRGCRYPHHLRGSLDPFGLPRRGSFDAFGKPDTSRENPAPICSLGQRHRRGATDNSRRYVTASEMSGGFDGMVICWEALGLAATLGRKEWQRRTRSRSDVFGLERILLRHWYSPAVLSAWNR